MSLTALLISLALGDLAACVSATAVCAAVEFCVLATDGEGGGGSFSAINDPDGEFLPID